MLESLCRSYCPNTWYQYLGQYFWPEKLITYSPWLSRLAALDSSVQLAVGGGACIAVATVAGALYLRKRHPQEIPKVEDRPIEQALEPKEAEVTPPIIRANTATTIKRTIPALHRTLTVPIVPKKEYQPGERFPVDSIRRAYLASAKETTRRNRAKNPAATLKITQQVLTELGLPLDGCYPTDPAELRHFNDVVVKLGLPEYCQPIPGQPVLATMTLRG